MSGIIVACKHCGVKNRIPLKKQHLQPRCGKCSKPVKVGTSAAPVKLGDADFQKFIHEAELPVMVDFFASTCGPCQALAPVIDNMAVRYLGKVIIAKVDTGTNPGTSAHYQIRGVPTLLFFKDGEMVDQVVGAPPEPALVDRLESLAVSS